LLVAPLAGMNASDGPLAVMVAGSSALVRDGADGTGLIVVGEQRAHRVALTEAHRSPVASGVGARYAKVAPGAGVEVAWAVPGSPLAHYRLGLAAEIAGTGRAALDHVAAFLTQRRAFGTTLGTFQALRHRIGELAVDVAGTSALVRQAAWHNDPVMIAGAVNAAVSLAAAASPELHQLSGARGFTAGFGLSRHTMLLQALRIEMGGVYETAVDYANARWGTMP
jgi:alkylation response protein AidB-like acyl-CoA dehydrogenase